MLLDLSGHSVRHDHHYLTSVGTVSGRGMFTWPQWAQCQAGWPQWAQCQAGACLPDLSGHSVRQGHVYLTSMGPMSGRIIFTWTQWAQCQARSSLPDLSGHSVTQDQLLDLSGHSVRQDHHYLTSGGTVSGRIIITWPQWAQCQAGSSLLDLSWHSVRQDRHCLTSVGTMSDRMAVNNPKPFGQLSPSLAGCAHLLFQLLVFIN